MKCYTSFQETSTFLTLDSDHGNAALFISIFNSPGLLEQQKYFSSVVWPLLPCEFLIIMFSESVTYLTHRKPD